MMVSLCIFVNEVMTMSKEFIYELYIKLELYIAMFISYLEDFEQLLSAISSVITIIAFFLVFRQWKRQVIANKKDSLSSKGIVLLKKIEDDIKVLRSPIQFLPSDKKCSEQQSWYYSKWSKPLFDHMGEFESVLVEYTILCGNEIQNKYKEGLRKDVKDLSIAFSDYIRYLQSEEKGNAYRSYSPEKIIEVTHIIQGIDDDVERKISLHINELREILKSTLIQ